MRDIHRPNGLYVAVHIEPGDDDVHGVYGQVIRLADHVVAHGDLLEARLELHPAQAELRRIEKERHGRIVEEVALDEHIRPAVLQVRAARVR